MANEITVVQVGNSFRWKCSCGIGSSGRWYSSIEEATKAANRHMKKVHKE